MKKNDFKHWLEIQGYQPGTIVSKINRAERVEKYYGQLDTQFEMDRLASILEALSYSTEDERKNRPNPSLIPFEGDPRTNLASYSESIRMYQKFRMDETSADSTALEISSSTPSNVAGDDEGGQRLALERDMQAALRLDIEQLENGLAIIDGGAERSVESGFIDITARDVSGATVVVELKTGLAGQRAIAQILSYMGDIMAEKEDGMVRGILVASEFDARSKAAARVIPNLILRKYSVRFTFSDGNG